jgi:antitoxin VapB
MANSTVFTTSGGQIVSLPKAVAFPDKVHQVEILMIGRSRVIVPKESSWDDFFEDGPKASEEFLVDRHQPSAEVREAF